MLILVIGQGAREHAITQTLLRDSDQTSDGIQVVCAPGNPGIAQITRTCPVSANNPDSVLQLAKELAADLVVIGPEAPLVAGVADVLRQAGFAVFGPSAQAAKLEGSKAFAKEVMQAAGVPTAQSAYCVTVDEAAVALDKFGSPYVVKDDGLAAGKGVVVTSDRQEALEHAMACIDSRDGAAVVIEEFLAGPEISLFGISDGKTIIPLTPAQDFKRIFNYDQGPNTGGMGAYSPLPWAPKGLVEDVHKNILQPVITEMANRGTPFIGLLFAGLALTSKGVKVIEFNARFGDPETQVVLARLSSPLGEVLYAAATGKLSTISKLTWRDDAAVTVVMAAQGYPESPVTGAVISGLADVNQDVIVYHAGTSRIDSGDYVVNGGRVLSVTATGSDLADARQKAYAAVERINFVGEHYRTDIALAAAQGEIEVP